MKQKNVPNIQKITPRRPTKILANDLDYDTNSNYQKIKFNNG